MADKYVKLDYVSGLLKEQEATVQSSGSGDAGKIIALGNDGKVDVSILPVGVGPQVMVLPAFENLSAGNLVNVFNDGGVAKVRKADASAVGKEAHGFVLQSYNSGQTAVIYFSDEVTGLSGLTPGARYFLSDETPGAVTTTPPSTSGSVVQYIGVATSSSSLFFKPGQPVVLA